MLIVCRYRKLSHCFFHTEFQFSRLKSKIPNRKSPISNLQPQISNPKSHISNLKSQISNLKSQLSHLQISIVGHIFDGENEREKTRTCFVLSRFRHLRRIRRCWLEPVVLQEITWMRDFFCLVSTDTGHLWCPTTFSMIPAVPDTVRQGRWPHNPSSHESARSVSDSVSEGSTNPPRYRAKDPSQPKRPIAISVLRAQPVICSAWGKLNY